MAAKLSVSVIIPTYNRKEDLKRCLASVLKQDFPKNFEIIVIDDASTDGTLKMIKKRFNQVRVLRNKKNLGVSKAKNKAVRKSKGEYLWFLDSDTEIVGNDCLKFLFEYLRNNGKVGSLGCELIERRGKWLIREHSFFKNDKTWSLSKKVFTKSVDYSATCNCFVKADLIRKIGGFNEHYFYGYEDAELGKKILDLGYLNLLDSRAAAHHRRSAKTRTANYKLFFKNRIRFCLWNFSFIDFIKLPLIDIGNFYQGIKLSKRIEAEEIKGQSRSKLNLFFGKFGLLTEYLVGLSYGYFWNLIFFPKTLFFDKKRADYV